MSKNLVTKVTAIFDRILAIGAISAGVSLVFVMLSIALDVTLRYSLNRPILWTVEISQYIMVWITFMATAWLLKREGHVSMDQVINRLNPKTQALLNTITSTFGAIACLIVAWYGTQVTWGYFRGGDYYFTLLEAPKWPMTAIVVIGSFLLFIQFLRRSNWYLARWRASSDNEVKP